jgi:hypothetical protein
VRAAPCPPLLSRTKRRTDPFKGVDLATVDSATIATMNTMREAAESAETDDFNPQIAAASGAAKDALSVGKIKNKVLKLTAETQVLNIKVRPLCFLLAGLFPDMLADRCGQGGGQVDGLARERPCDGVEEAEQQHRDGHEVRGQGFQGSRISTSCNYRFEDTKDGRLLLGSNDD